MRKELREELQGVAFLKEPGNRQSQEGVPSVTSRNEPISRRDSLSHLKETCGNTSCPSQLKASNQTNLYSY